MDKARQAAHYYKEQYWKCLAAEIVRSVPTNMSAQDFSLLIKGSCPDEKKKFLVPLIDYIATQDPNCKSVSDCPIDNNAVFSAANIAVTAAQDDALKGFIEMRAGKSGTLPK